jgi:hypothetical protein
MIFISLAHGWHDTPSMSATLAAGPLAFFSAYRSLWLFCCILDLSPDTAAKAPEGPVGHPALSPPDG